MKKKLDKKDKVLILGSVMIVVIGVFLFALLGRFLKEDKAFDKAGIISKTDNYATMSWVYETLYTYLGDVTEDDKIRDISASIGTLDSLSDDELRALYLKVEEGISNGDLGLPEDKVKELTRAITEKIVEGYGKDLSDEDLSKLKEYLSDVEFELSIMKESGIDIGALGSISEEDLKGIMSTSGLSKEVIEGWIRSSSIDLQNGYEEADEDVLYKAGLSDKELDQKIEETKDSIDYLYRDVIDLKEGKIDEDDAIERLSKIDGSLSDLEKAIGALDGEKAGIDSDLQRKIDEAREDLYKTREELKKAMDDNKEKQDKALSDTKEELKDTIKTNKRKAEDSINETKETLQSSITDNKKKTDAAIDKTNERVGDIESKSLLEYSLDDSDPENIVLYLRPIELRVNGEDYSSAYIH